MTVRKVQLFIRTRIKKKKVSNSNTKIFRVKSFCRNLFEPSGNSYDLLILDKGSLQCNNGWSCSIPCFYWKICVQRPFYHGLKNYQTYNLRLDASNYLNMTVLEPFWLRERNFRFIYIIFETNLENF